MLTQFAVQEFRRGSPARAATVFEGLLAAYPRALDVWTVYTDQLCARARASGAVVDVAAARAVFCRAASLRLSSKKMRFLFKRWAAFEAAHGDEASAAAVAAAAREYVASVAAGAGDG